MTLEQVIFKHSKNIYSLEPVNEPVGGSYVDSKTHFFVSMCGESENTIEFTITQDFKYEGTKVEVYLNNSSANYGRVFNTTEEFASWLDDMFNVGGKNVNKK